MGRQKGILKLKGRVGEFSFFKSSRGMMAREKDGIEGDRIRTDPRYARTRENGAEFGQGAKASKLIRDAIRVLLIGTADSGVSNRLTREMLKVVKSDPMSDRGLRMAMNGDLTLLKNFEFNTRSPFKSTFFAQYVTEVTRASGEIKITLPDFDTKTIVTYPEGTTHLRFIAAAVELDFTENTYDVVEASSQPLAINTGLVSTPPLVMNVFANTTKPLVVVLGITFDQIVNGKPYLLNDGSFNALRVVHAESQV